MSDSRPIGVFDSGVGGLTIVKELLTRLPGEQIIYFGDTARVPYGSKSARTLRRYAVENTRFLCDHDVKAVVVACNTATALALPQLLNEFTLPILGVIEAGAKEAIAVSASQRIGVLGTRNTVRCGIYEQTLLRENPKAQVTAVACPLFVPLAEEHYLDHAVTRVIAQEYLMSLQKQKVDTVLLGCTHYPLLRPLIEEIMGPEVAVVDSASCCAAALSNLLAQTGRSAGSDVAPPPRFFVSDDPHHFSTLGSLFLGQQVSASLPDKTPSRDQGN